MYDLVVRYLARAFVQHTQAEVSLNAYSALATALGAPDMVPRQMTEVSLLGGRPIPRLALATREGDWVVQISGESVDVQYSPLPDRPSIPFTEYAERASQYVAGGVRYLGVQAHRLASVQEGLLWAMSAEEFARWRRRLLSLPPVLGTTEPFEWDWRIARAGAHAVADIQHATNTVITVKRVLAQLLTGQRLDRLFVTSDINTSPAQTRPRMSAEDAQAFVVQSSPWHSDVLDALRQYAEAP